MKNSTLNELYVNELQDLMSAENQLVKALPAVLEAVSSPQLRNALEGHLEETRGHVVRLDAIFKSLGKTPENQTCEGMKGLIKESEHAIKTFEMGPVRDAAIICGCRIIEHHEMAAYGVACAIAETLGYTSQAESLNKSRDEELEVNDMLAMIASEKVNPAAKEASMTQSAK